MILSALHSRISRAIGRGTAYDAEIPDYVKEAALFIERNYTFQYMNRFSTFTLDADAAQPRLITLPTRLKKDNLIRIVNADGTYGKLAKIDPQQQTALLTEPPTGYYLDGDTRIWLAQIPDQDYSCEIFWTAFTTWPTDYSNEPWLAANASDVLMAQTMVDMAPHLKDETLTALWGGKLTMHMKSLLDADLDLQEANKPAVMHYGTTDP